MLLNDKAMTRLANDLAFEVWDMHNEYDTWDAWSTGLWAGIYHLLYAQAMTANAIEGIDVDPYKVRQHIEDQVKLAYAHLFPNDTYPEDDD